MNVINKEVEPIISKSLYREVKVDFSLFTNHTHTKTLFHKFTKNMEFWEHNTKKEIREEIESLCRSYEGHERNTYICEYKIISIKEKKVVSTLKGKIFRRIKK